MSEPAAPAATPPAPQAAAPVKTATGPLNDAEQQQLLALQARAAAAQVDAGEAVVMTVGEPHSEFIYGGVTVTAEPTTVPAHLVAPLTAAAAEAGVTLTQES
jgi:hypothetical protein